MQPNGQDNVPLIGKYNSYKIRYTIEVGDFKREDAQPHQGLTESCIMISIMNPPDGSYSQDFEAYSGQTHTQLSDFEVYKAWIMMAASLAKPGRDLAPGIQAFIRDVWETWRLAVLANKEGACSDHNCAGSEGKTPEPAPTVTPPAPQDTAWEDNQTKWEEGGDEKIDTSKVEKPQT